MSTTYYERAYYSRTVVRRRIYASRQMRWLSDAIAGAPISGLGLILEALFREGDPRRLDSVRSTIYLPDTLALPVSEC
jgi:hypothetical protein